MLSDHGLMIDSHHLQQAEIALMRGSRFAFERDLISFDPGDLIFRFPPALWALHRRNSRLARLVWRASVLIDVAFPKAMRWLMGIRPSCENQSLMLGLELCLLLGETADGNWKARIPGLIAELDAVAIVDEKGMGWSKAYPFFLTEPDGSSIIISPTARSVHATVMAGNVLSLLDENLEIEGLRHRIISIAEFLMHGVHRTLISSTASAIAYTDIDHCQITNVSADAGSFLVRMGKKFSRPDWIKAGLEFTKFVVEAMRPGGGWGYLPQADSPEDNCHTVIVLRGLLDVFESGDEAKAIDLSSLRSAFERGMRHYIDSFFRKDGMARAVPSSDYRERSYDTAYAIRMLIKVIKSRAVGSEMRADCFAQLERVVKYVLRFNQRRSGEFILQRRARFPFWFPNMRHGQLQMCVALAEYCDLIRKNS